MKKVLFFLVFCVIVAGIIHVTTTRYGGLPGTWHRSQARVINVVAQITKDPGKCAYIRGYWGRSIHERLRDRCVKIYVFKTVKKRSDCRTDTIPRDIATLSNLSLKEEYRYTCLLQHYKNMLGNSLTQEWLPEKCLQARDNLVEMNYYFSIIRNARAARMAPDFSSTPNLPDLVTVDECEKMLNTPKIYGFLRKRTFDYRGFTPEERAYIAEQQHTFPGVEKMGTSSSSGGEKVLTE